MNASHTLDRSETLQGARPEAVGLAYANTSPSAVGQADPLLAAAGAVGDQSAGRRGLLHGRQGIDSMAASASDGGGLAQLHKSSLIAAHEGRHHRSRELRIIHRDAFRCRMLR